MSTILGQLHVRLTQFDHHLRWSHGNEEISNAFFRVGRAFLMIAAILVQIFHRARQEIRNIVPIPLLDNIDLDELSGCYRTFHDKCLKGNLMRTRQRPWPRQTAFHNSFCFMSKQHCRKYQTQS